MLLGFWLRICAFRIEPCMRMQVFGKIGYFVGDILVSVVCLYSVYFKAIYSHGYLPNLQDQ